jgi:ribosomal protein L22
MATALARLEDARISLKHAIVICKSLRNKKVDKAKRFLKNLIDKKVSLKRKYYTKAAKKILEVLETAEANAKVKNLNLEKLFIKTAKADKGPTLIRPRSRFRFRGRKFKSTHITIEVEER